ncbi:MAG: helicase C-terminal domain-containing protein, partial [Candidatus Hadarchaeia archaeon]
MKKQLFPYKYRENQREMEKNIHNEVWDSNICIHAATGFGKTPVILSALLPHTEDNRIIWAVRTGNETDRPVEELRAINHNANENFFGISYRGKRDMCLLARDRNIDEKLSYGDVSFMCEEVGMDCPYRKNLEKANPEEFDDNPLLYSDILDISKNLEICPYYFQRELLPLTDLVSLSYNYVISEDLSWVIEDQIPFQKSFLVMDEAHNLQRAARGMNSDRITLGTLNRSAGELGRMPGDRAEELLDLIELLREELKNVGDGLKRESEVDMNDFVHGVIKNWGKDPFEFRIDVEELVTFGTKLRRKQLNEGKRPRSSIYHLGKFWTRALDKLDVDGIAFLLEREKDNLSLEMIDMRTSEILNNRWKKFKGCVFCSGTLKPIKAFATTAGLSKNVKSIIVGSFYDQNNIVSLLPSGLTTKGKKLEDKMARLYVKSIGEFSEKISSNVAVFSSSYRIQRRLMEEGLKEILEDQGRKLYLEERGMDGNTARNILDGFKRETNKGGDGFLCATASGRFAEGADFPGMELEGIFLVGIPFEKMNLRTELY